MRERSEKKIERFHWFQKEAKKQKTPKNKEKEQGQTDCALRAAVAGSVLLNQPNLLQIPFIARQPGQVGRRFPHQKLDHQPRANRTTTTRFPFRFPIGASWGHPAPATPLQPAPPTCENQRDDTSLRAQPPQPARGTRGCCLVAATGRCCH